MNARCICCGQVSWKQKFTTYDYMFNNLEHSYQLYQCQSCKLLQLQEYEHNDSLYPEGQYYSYQNQSKYLPLKCLLYSLCFSPLPSWLSFIRAILLFPLRQMMRTLVACPGTRVLDVGCGSGKFLSIIHYMGMIGEGVDIEPKAIETVQEHGFTAYCMQFDEQDISMFSNKFDFVVSHHVIEHVKRPDIFLQNIANLLKPEGKAIISTPTYFSIWGLFFGRYWSQIDSPRHLYIFSQQNMKTMCDAHELRIIAKRHLSSEVGVTLSLVYMCDNLGFRLSDRTKKRLIVLSRYLLFPLYSLVNILRIGDTIEYTLIKNQDDL